MKSMLVFLTILAMLAAPALAEEIELQQYNPQQAAQSSAPAQPAKDGSVSLVQVEDPYMYMLLTISISPDGQTRICSDGTTLSIVRGNTVIPVRPDEQSSLAPDEYGNLAALCGMGGQFFGMMTASWSADSRYVVLSAPALGIDKGRSEIDPVIIDTQTGGAMLSVTFSNHRTNGAVMVHAAFDQESGRMFYTVHGKDEGSLPEMTSLLSFDIETGKTLLHDYHGDLLDGTALVPMGRGVFCTAGIQNNGKTVLELYRREGTTCYRTALNVDQADRTYLLEDVRGSEKSGLFLFWSSRKLQNSDEIPGMRVMEIHNDYARSGYIWVVNEEGTAQYMYMSDYNNLSHPERYLEFLQVQMSPDGESAMVLAGGNGRAYLLLLDLIGNTYRRVELPEGVNAEDIADMVISGEYANGFRWCADGTLIIPNDEGLGMYRIAQ